MYRGTEGWLYLVDWKLYVCKYIYGSIALVGPGFLTVEVYGSSSVKHTTLYRNHLDE